MAPMKVLAASLAAGLLASASVSALAAEQANPTRMKTFQSAPGGRSLKDAINAAQESSSGTVLDIHYGMQNGQGRYQAHLLEHGQLMNVSIDPRTGSVGPWTALKQSATPTLKTEQRADMMLRPGETSLSQAVALAEKEGGKPVDARLTMRKGKPAYEVGLVSNDKRHTVLVDPETGKMTS